MGQIRLLESIATVARTGNLTATLGPSVINIGGAQYRTSSNITLNIGGTGVGGLDTGTIAANTLYYIHAVVSNGFPALIASLSKTAPSGFTNFRYLKQGFWVNNSSQIAMIVNSTTWDSRVEALSVVSAGTGPTAQAHVWRAGQYLMMNGQVVLGSSPPFLPVTLVPPTNHTPDLNKLIATNLFGPGASTSGQFNIGEAMYFYTSTNTNFSGICTLNGGNGRIVFTDTRMGTGNAGNQWGQGEPIATSLVGDTITFQCQIPIVGWSATDF